MIKNNVEIYVANLGKYNEGFLVGKWLTLPCTEEEKQELFVEIGLGRYVDGIYRHGVEKDGVFYEEYAIHDVDIPVEYDGMLEINEYDSIDSASEKVEKLEELEDYELELVGALMRNNGVDIDEAIDLADGNCSYLYLDKFTACSDEVNMAYTFIEEAYGDISNLPREILERHFDVEHFGRELGWDLECLIEDYEEDEKEQIRDMSDEELGEWYIDILGGIEFLGQETLENYFDHHEYGRDLLFDYCIDGETMIATCC